LKTNEIYGKMTVQYDDDFMSQRNFINEWKDSNEGG
jgi:hypothetical protein